MLYRLISSGLKLDLHRELNALGLDDVDSGGIQLEYEGPGGALNAHEVLFNDRGFSTEAEMLSLADAHTNQAFELRTPQFAIGPADLPLGLSGKAVFEPTLVLHNFADSTTTGVISVDFYKDGKPAEKQLPFEAGHSEVMPLYDRLKGIGGGPADS